MVNKYRKKPVVIEALQWNGSNHQEVSSFIQDTDITYEGNNTIKIQTLEGNMIASKGDYIIKGYKGEFYPCKPDIFDSTYEYVTDIENVGDLIPNKKLIRIGLVAPSKKLCDVLHNSWKENIELNFGKDVMIFKLFDLPQALGLDLDFSYILNKDSRNLGYQNLINGVKNKLASRNKADRYIYVEIN